MKFLHTIVMALTLVATAPAPAAAQFGNEERTNPAVLDGYWEFTGVCRERNVRVWMLLSPRENGRFRSTVFFDPGTSHEAFRVEGFVSGDRLVMEPTYDDIEKVNMRHGAKYRRYNVVFERTNGRWSGRLEDPTCSTHALARPGPPPLVTAAGAAASSRAWLGKSPMERIGQQTMFDYVNRPVAAVLNDAERTMQWSPVTVGRIVTGAGMLSVSLSAYVSAACVSGSCTQGEGRRVFTISNDRMHFASSIGHGRSQVCTMGQNSRTWFCHRVARAFPHQLSNAELAQWMWTTSQDEDAAWRRANPLPLPNCRTVYQYDRDGPHSPRTVCDPTPPGPAKPNSPRL